MNKKRIYLFFIALLTLSACNNPSSSSEVPSSENNLSSEIISSEDTVTSENPSTSEEDQSSEDSSSELPPLSDPDVFGLVRSSLWPSEALNAYLTYAENIDMPIFTSYASFHHGEYENEYYLPFYRVLTRVHSKQDFYQYLNSLEEDFDFTVVEEDGLVDVYYAKSQYDDVKAYVEYRYVSNRHEVIFDFFDGEGDKYTGPVAVNNVAKFDLRTKEALSSRSDKRAKWEVRPATFTVYKNNAGYPVGHENGAHLSNPLRIYPGQSAKFSVPSKYYIVSIKLLASSGYASDTVLDGTFTNASAVDDVDFVYITPIGQPNEIEYQLAQVMYVDQVRWLEVHITFAKR